MTSSRNSSSGVNRLGMASRCCSLVLPLALAAVLTLAPTASAAGGAARFQKPYNVCTSDWAPIVSPYLAAANALEQQWGCQHSRTPRRQTLASSMLSSQRDLEQPSTFGFVFCVYKRICIAVPDH
jgi:hypothetical protein